MAAGETVRFTNELNSPVVLWLMTEGSTNGWTMKMEFKRGNKDLSPNPGTRKFRLPAPGSYYMLFQFSDRSQMDLGWVNVSRAVEIDPEIELVVGVRPITHAFTVSIPYQEQVEQVYSVAVPEVRQRIVNYTVQTPNGTEVRSRTVDYTVMKTEQRNDETLLSPKHVRKRVRG